MTPPRRCHNCGSRNVEAIREPKRFNVAGCFVAWVFFVALTAMIYAAIFGNRQ
jgi:hypothetical protein